MTVYLLSPDRAWNSSNVPDGFLRHLIRSLAMTGATQFCPAFLEHHNLSITPLRRVTCP